MVYALGMSIKHKGQTMSYRLEDVLEDLYVVITWPESQKYMENANTHPASEEIWGDCAYFVPLVDVIRNNS